MLGIRKVMGILALAIGLAASGLWAAPAAEVNLTWRVAQNWPGEVTGVRADGVTGRVNQLKVTPSGDGHIGRCFHFSRVRSPWGRKFLFEARVKGEGELRLGVLKHLTTPEQGLRAFTDWDEAVHVLGGDWQAISHEFVFEEPDISRFGIVVEVSGDDGATVYLAEGVLEPIQTPGISLTAVPLPLHPMVEAGQPLPEITFSLSGDDEPYVGQPLTVLANAQTRDAITDNQGNVVYQPPADIDYLAATYPGSGVVVEAHVDVLPPERYQAYDEIARNIELEEPLHLLILGDSLSDFDRGRNYVDKVNFWLNHYNPGMADFHNAGVGGDFITRSLDRLSGRPAHRREMYDGIFDREADYIFIFLGHNDTRSSSDEDHVKPQVSPEKQEEGYREFISMLQANSGGKIVLVSATSSNFELTQANSEKSKAEGRRHSLFGDPEKLEAFNAVLEKLADELDLDYLDVYNPTLNAPDKASLFSPTDGVHLSEEGHRFIALQFLKYMEQQRPSYQ